MHPEMSLVVLTVLAGTGQGIFILLVALNTLFSSAVPSGFVMTGGILSLLLQVVGIISSTSHLGNPQRGWRAMLMIKNSWLSREVITLSMSVGAAAVYLLLSFYGIAGAPLLIVGLAGIAANIGFYISSSMVYASVKFIREWANVYTPLNFMAFGITSGIAAGLPVLYRTNADPFIIHGVTLILTVLTVLCLLMKILAYRFNANTYVSVNIKNALGINDPDIKLIDMGSSYDHYNTKEYFHRITEKANAGTKSLVVNIAFVLPLIIWVSIALKLTGGYSLLLSIIAAVSMTAGLVVERRLFFIHGNNIQNLYYNNFRSTGARNPIVSKARKGTAVPMN